MSLMRALLSSPILAAMAFACAGLYIVSPPPSATPGFGGNLIMLTQALGLASFVANVCWGLAQDYRLDRIALDGFERLLTISLFLYYLGVHCDDINNNAAFLGYELITYFAYAGLFLGVLQSNVRTLLHRSRLQFQSPTGSFQLRSQDGPFITAKGVGSHSLADRRPVAPADLRITCVHEVGHLLVYKATSPFPVGVDVSVKTHLAVHDTIAGQVRRGHASSRPGKITKPYLHWTMLLTLAGTVAEEVVLGEAYAGSRSDYVNWLVTAKFYLECGFGPVFYPGADTEEEMANNRLVINALHQEHRELLRELMTLNRDWIARTADLLMVEHCFGTRRAQELLESAVLPASFQPVNVQDEHDSQQAGEDQS